jgi:hypothetical protein
MDPAALPTIVVAGTIESNPKRRRGQLSRLSLTLRVGMDCVNLYRERYISRCRARVNALPGHCVLNRECSEAEQVPIRKRGQAP